MKKNRLKNPKIHKIDLVFAGAQQHSNIEIKKSKEEKPVAKFDENKIGKLSELLDGLKALFSEEAKEPHHADIKEQLEAAAESTTKEEAEEEKADTEPEVEEEKAVECSADSEKPEEEAEKADEETEEKEEDAEAEKACEPEVEKSADVIKKYQDEIAKMQDEIAKMREAEIKKSFVAKAKELDSIPNIKSDDLSELLFNIYKSDNKNYEALENLLTSCNEVIKTGAVFNEYGTDAEVSSNVSKAEAWASIETLAKNKAKEMNCTEEQAMNIVLKSEQGIRLYNIYNQSK